MNFTRAIVRSLQLRGIRGTAEAIVSNIVPRRIKNLELYTAALKGNTGLEIGGPSAMFADNGALPIYSTLETLDNCNFSNSTVWEGTLTEGMSFQFHKNKHPGRQFISEATALNMIPSGSYDCVLSSNTIEHVANPLKALLEWKRVIKEQGHLLLVVPHRDASFDHNRPITPFNHIVRDFEEDTDEHDLTHLEEILSLHDLDMDPAAGGEQVFRERSLRNFENRCLHHHVFDTALVVHMLNFIDMQILSVDPAFPFLINVLARKPILGEAANNEPFLSQLATYRKSSPFRSDRTGNFPQT